VFRLGLFGTGSCTSSTRSFVIWLDKSSIAGTLYRASPPCGGGIGADDNESQ
jgi:hypothetical protein